MNKEPKNAEDTVVLIQDFMYPKASFDANNEPKYITSDEAKYNMKKVILTARVRPYI